MRASTKRKISNVITAIMLLVGIGLVSWPWVSNVISDMNMQTLVASSTNQSDGLTKEEKDEFLAQARSYNVTVAQANDVKPMAEITVKDLWPYAKQLTTQDDPMMAWLEIPTIGVKLPIYHGTSTSALMAGVGHLERTSLPVGGQSTHCVLSGHSGMTNLSMFDDIRNLKDGDEVYIHVLGDTLAYRVYASEVVLPNEMSSLNVQQDKDLLTLVTCTPYGVNDHRLLVHCKRCEYTEEAHAAQADLRNRHLGMRDYGILGGGLAAMVALITFVAKKARKRKHKIASSYSPSNPS